MHKRAQAQTSLHKLARAHISMHKCAQALMSLHKHSQARPSARPHSPGGDEEGAVEAQHALEVEAELGRDVVPPKATEAGVGGGGCGDRAGGTW